MKHFLRVAVLVFSEETVSAVFLPALADFQAELRESSGSRARRALTYFRWWWALATLLAVTPFSAPSPNGGWFVLLLCTPMVAAAWLCMQEFALGALLLGVALAWLIRAWNDQHPSVIAVPPRVEAMRIVQINIAAIPVTADAAGLIVAAGTILIVVIALVEMWWFFAAAAIGSLLVAWTRFAVSQTRRPFRPVLL